MAKDERKFWQKKTTWGCVLLFLAGGLQAVDLGSIAVMIQQVAAVLGLPLTAYGIADRVSKK